MKECNRCHRRRQLTSFHRCRTEVDGLQRKCKDCVIELQRLKRERIKSGEHQPRPRLKHPRGRKICTKCGEVKKATTEFFEELATGFRGLFPECRVCRQSAKLERIHGWPWAKRLISYVNGPRHTSRTTEPFDLTTEFLEMMFARQEGRCAWTGVKMTTDIGSDRLRIVTLDRLDNTRGYTSDNVTLVCKAANQARGDASVEEFVRFLDDVRG